MDSTVIIILLTALVAALVAAAVCFARYLSAKREVSLLQGQLSALGAADDRFRTLAAEALRLNSAELTRQTAGGVSALLTPLREHITRFEATVTDNYSREARERFALDDRVRQLADVSRAVGLEARQLAQALKGNNRVQGDWGEAVLENLLQKAGLQRDRDYLVQQSVTDSEGRRLRPDVIVCLPDKRAIVIDSKVSMKAYFDMLEADSAEGVEAAGRQLVQAMKNQIAELRTKRYQDVLEGRKLDFVLMFIPHEGAYLSALRAEPQLCSQAFDQHVLPVSPTHLMAVLAMVDRLWQQERQQRNAAEIGRQAGLMLDKLSAFLTDMERIDRSLTQAREAYGSAMNKLTDGTGNLLTRAQRLQDLGAKATKTIKHNSQYEE